ncbi:MAG TPA: hypothetical protein PLY56_09540, partial [Armatimonadota bacterium]|nr:hypothetical protein [Armatimonadota bacterium]
MARDLTRSELLRPFWCGSRFTWVAALTACALLSAMTQASARERQLAGIRLGRPANQVTELFGDPTRTFTGVPTGGQAGMPGAEGMGVPGMAPGGPAMPGMEAGMAGDPMMGMAPGGMGAGAGIAVPPRQKYEGKIAAMKPEEFVGRLLAAPAAAMPVGGVPGMEMAPGAMPGGVTTLFPWLSFPGLSVPGATKATRAIGPRGVTDFLEIEEPGGDV